MRYRGIRTARVGQVALVSVLGWGQALAEEVVLDPIAVTAQKLVTPTKQAEETVYTGTAVTAKGIEIQGAKASMQVYGAIDILPGVYLGERYGDSTHDDSIDAVFLAELRFPRNLVFQG